MPVIRPWLRAALLALALAACDDFNERRTQAIHQSQSSDDAAAAQGAASLEKLLEQRPSDGLLLYHLGRYKQRHGSPVEARLLFEKLVAMHRDSDEVVLAREELARLLAAEAAEAARSSPPPTPGNTAEGKDRREGRDWSGAPPLTPLAITPGKAIGKLVLGRPFGVEDRMPEFWEKKEGSEQDELRVHDFRTGVSAVFRKGKLVRASAHRGGRSEQVGGKSEAYRGFVGQTPEGVTVGMSEQEALAKLGPPSGRRLPRAPVIDARGEIAVELIDYAKKGLSLEIDLTSKGRVVGAIHVPTIEGRPLPGKPTGKP